MIRKDNPILPRVFFLVVLTFFLSHQNSVAESSFLSGPHQVSLLELYTSEGCSSCPPADQMFTQLKSSPDLWKKVVPVAFHVDYWNSPAWMDRMSDAQFTRRQKDYIRQWQGQTSYTPMLVFNGTEFRRGTISEKPQFNVGYLKLIKTTPGSFEVTFVPKDRLNQKDWMIHIALLGFGISSYVTAGENAGQTLKHDFAVLAFASKKVELDKGKLRTSFKLEADRLLQASQMGIAAWVTLENDLRPVQAVGGFIVPD